MGRSPTVFLLSFFLLASVNLLFGLVKILNLLNIRYYYAYSQRIVDITFFSDLIDGWLWLSSLLFIVGILFIMIEKRILRRWIIIPSVVSLALSFLSLISSQTVSTLATLMALALLALSIYTLSGVDIRRKEAVVIVILFALGLLIVFELASLGAWMVNAFDFETSFGSGLRWWFPNIDLNLFNVLYPSTSWLLLIFLFSWIWISPAKFILARLDRGFSTKTITEGTVNRRILSLALILILVAAFFVGYYPYFHLSPPALIGVDSLSMVDYYSFLTRMVQEGPSIALKSDRPFFFLILYFLKLISMQPVYFVIRIMPAICAVGLALASFWIARLGTKNDQIALLASGLSVFSFQTTAEMYGYLLSNWFMIIEMMIFFGLLLKSFEKRSTLYLLVAGFISIAALVTHT